MELPRVFIGCLVDLNATRRATELSLALRRRALDAGWKASWVAPPALHLTLRFVGDIDPGLVSPLSSLVARVAAEHEPPRVSLAGVSAFPTVDSPRVIYVEVQQGAEALAAIASALDDGLDGLGLPPRDRPFHPHLTLARVKHAAGPLAAIAPGRSDCGFGVAHDLTLWRSDGARPNAEYPALARAPLGVKREPAGPQGEAAKP